LCVSMWIGNGEGMVDIQAMKGTSSRATSFISHVGNMSREGVLLVMNIYVAAFPV